MGYEILNTKEVAKLLKADIRTIQRNAAHQKPPTQNPKKQGNTERTSRNSREHNPKSIRRIKNGKGLDTGPLQRRRQYGINPKMRTPMECRQKLHLPDQFESKIATKQMGRRNSSESHPSLQKGMQGETQGH